MIVKTIVSAEKLQELIQAEVDKTGEVGEGKAKVRVPLPMRLAESDEPGCNWTILSLSGNDIDVELIVSIIARLRSQYNLPQ